MKRDEYLTAYRNILEGYLRTGEESFLLQAFNLGKQMLKDDLSSEFVADMHFRTLEKIDDELRYLRDRGRHKADIPFLELTMAFGMAFRDQLGALMCFTERIEARKEWEISFNAITEPISILDSKSCIVQANKAFYELLGKTYQEIIGLPCWRLFCDTDEPPEGCKLPGCISLSLHQHASYDVYIQKLDRHFNTSVHPIQGSTDLSSCFVYIMKDVTEQKKMEEEMRKSMTELERFNRLAEDRELRMIELKREVNRLCERLGENPPYSLSFVDE